MTTVFHARQYGRFVEIKNNLKRKFIKIIKAPIFLEELLAIEIRYEPQSNSEEKDNPSILKDDFSSKNKCTQFHINSTSVISMVKRNKFEFFQQ